MMDRRRRRKAGSAGVSIENENCDLLIFASTVSSSIVRLVCFSLNVFVLTFV